MKYDDTKKRERIEDRRMRDGRGDRRYEDIKYQRYEDKYTLQNKYERDYDQRRNEDTRYWRATDSRADSRGGETRYWRADNNY